MSSETTQWNEPPDDLEWNDWGPAVRVRVDHAPVAIFARAVKDSSQVYRAERAALTAADRQRICDPAVCEPGLARCGGRGIGAAWGPER